MGKHNLGRDSQESSNCEKRKEKIKELKDPVLGLLGTAFVWFTVWVTAKWRGDIK